MDDEVAIEVAFTINRDAAAGAEEGVDRFKRAFNNDARLATTPVTETVSNPS